MNAPALVVTIDCEEEGLWSGSYRLDGNTCRNIRHLPRVQEVFSRLGVVPTYLVDHPVTTDDVAVRVLGDLGGEIGAHLHPWCTPPLFEASTYTHRLPPSLQEAKLETLCRAIQDAFGKRPRTYRAGRWGFDHTTVPVLERLGFTVDTSVDPLWWDPSPGGPVFVRAPQAPYRLSAADVCVPGSSSVLEVPVSAAIPGRRGLERLVRRIAPLPGLRRWLLRAGLASLKVELCSLAQMCAVADELTARGPACLNVMFHSSTLMPGATPYVADAAAAREFVRRLETLLEYLIRCRGAQPLGLSQVPEWADRNRDTKRAVAAASE